MLRSQEKKVNVAQVTSVYKKRKKNTMMMVQTLNRFKALSLGDSVGLLMAANISQYSLSFLYHDFSLIPASHDLIHH